MTGQVVWQFSRQHTVSSYFIRYGTRSDWSHVDAVLPDGTLLGSRHDTKVPGVQIRQANYAKFSATLRVGITTALADKFYDTLHGQIGKPYDWRAVVAFAFGDRDWQSESQWFCSELQIWAMKQAGFFPHIFDFPLDRLSPRDQLLLLSPWLFLC